MEENNHDKEMHMWHGDFISWFGQCLLHVVVTSFGQGLHSPFSSDPEIKLEYYGFLAYLKSSLCEESPQVGVSHALYNLISNELKSRGGSRIKHMRQTCSNSRTQVEREEHKGSTLELQLKTSAQISIY
jgi:hypothetical protein